jgi:protein ImuB
VLEEGPLAAAQIDFSGAGAEGDDLAGLMDRLAARLGASRITRYVPVDSHVPERAVLARPFACASPETWTAEQQESETPPDRPLRLFARPEPVEVMAEVPEGHPLRFRWRRVVHEVAHAEGPERIAPEWWQPDDQERATRDYYRVEDEEGRRYWLYREGLYGRETATPAWYVHGLFA